MFPLPIDVLVVDNNAAGDRDRGPSRIRSQALALGAIPVAFLLLLLAVVGVLRFQTESAARWVQNSENALKTESDLTGALIRANSALSAYAQKPTAARSAALRSALDIEPLAQQLVGRAKDDPAQERRALSIAALAREFTAYLSRAKIAFDSHDQRKLAELQKAFDSRSLSVAWEQQTAAFAGAEIALRDRRWAQFHAQNQIFNLVLMIGALVGVVLTIVASIAFARRIVGRIEGLAAAARRAQQPHDLPALIEGDDEIAQLGRVYHDMALSARSREAQLQKYRLLAEHARDIILFIRRSDGAILEANAAAAQAYGYTIEDLQRLNARDLRAPATLHRLDAELDRAEAAPIVFETAHRRKDGSVFPVEVAAQSVEIGGEKLMVSIVRDITERRLAQHEVNAALKQAVDAARSKSEFLATMSHEIRTPLNAVIGMTELLLHTPLSADQQHCASVAHDAGEALLHLINDILDFSKLEADRVDLEIIEFKLVPVVEGVAGLFAAAAAKNRVALMTYVNPDIPQVLLGDPGRLRQVLINLTGNAVKFTRDGSVVVTAEVLHHDAQAVEIAFAVKDTGIGIAPESISALFEPFKQADGSTTRRYGGTGLGLSISKRLVELMGSSIQVDSAPGAGSTFSFALKLKVAQSQPPEPRNLAQMRALVVDDDVVARDIFTRYLASWQMRCEVTGDPLDALKMVRSAAAQGDPYDVVIVDLVMPQMDGYELARRIHTAVDATHMRLIMVTAYDEAERGRAAIEAGFSGYLTKPVRQSQLYDCIVNASMAAHPATVEAVVEPERGGLRILIAEDNAVNREVALRQLGKLGYAAQAVADGAAAVDAALGGQFDLIFMDCQMPVMDGFEATRAIRKGEARSGKRVRIVAMTANALPEDRQACLEAGMDDYIAKPVTLEALRGVLMQKPELRALDTERLDQIFEGDRASVAEFLESALASFSRLIDRIEHAANASEAVAAAHELKGSAANAGTTEIAQIAAQLDKQLRAGNGDNSPFLGALRRALERAAAAAQSMECEA